MQLSSRSKVDQSAEAVWLTTADGCNFNSDTTMINETQCMAVSLPTNIFDFYIFLKSYVVLVP